MRSSVLILLATILVGCEGSVKITSKNQVEAFVVTPDSGLPAIVGDITVGNHTYVPFHVSGNPDEVSKRILLILDIFEKSNPDFEVTGWKIEKQQRVITGHSNWYAKDSIFGIWIDHKPKVNADSVLVRHKLKHELVHGPILWHTPFSRNDLPIYHY